MRSFVAGMCGLLVALPSFAEEPPTLRERLSGLSVGGHRGDSTASDGNTIRCFERIRKLGVDIIEMDLQLTADGVPVVYHDPETKGSTKGCEGRIREMTLAEIRDCRIANTEKIPTFEEVLEWAAGRVVVNAEFKHREVAQPAVALVAKYGAYDWIYFQTKSDPITYTLARRADARVALLYKPRDMQQLDWALQQDDPNLVVIEIDPDMRTPEVLKKVRDAGKLVSENAWHFCFTEEAIWDCCEEAFDSGIDIVISKQAAGCIEARDDR